MTNADKIRSMTDEELAKSKIYTVFDVAWCCEDIETAFHTKQEAFEAELKWLKQEVSE